MKRFFFAAFVSALFILIGSASENRPVIPDLSGMDTFDQIDPKEIGNFWTKWNLVTVRYRKDNDEERYVYANDIAWKALRAGKAEFPEGSMFGKVAFRSGEDPAFPVSVIPKLMSRIQIMVKRSTKYPRTGGWGYAIWPQAVRDKETPENLTQACFACHQIVKKSDYVFSEPAFFVNIDRSKRNVANYFQARFATRQIPELTHLQKDAFAAALGTKNFDQAQLGFPIKVYTMPIFLGSIWESLPTLAGFASSGQAAYLLIDEQTQQFILAVPEKPAPGCQNPARVYVQQKAHIKVPGSSLPPPQFQRTTEHFCKGKITQASYGFEQ